MNNHLSFRILKVPGGNYVPKIVRTQVIFKKWLVWSMLGMAIEMLTLEWLKQ